MQRTIIASIILLGTVLGAQAATTAPDSAKHPNSATPIYAKHHARKSQSSASGAVTYSRDSADPNVGWHWEGGMRVCHQDCDNPEIPGSSYTCRDDQALGMAMRECDTGN